MRNFWIWSFAYCCQEGSWKCDVNPDFPTYTLPKKKGNFQTVWRHPVSWNFSDDLHSDVLWLYGNGEEFLNGVFGKLLSWALQKWHLAQSSPTYIPPQKKGNFQKVAFLLGKSVVCSHWFSSDSFYADLAIMEDGVSRFYQWLHKSSLERIDPRLL